MNYIRIFSVAIFVFIISIGQSYSQEYICSFDTMLTGDVNKFSDHYKKLLETKAKSKFVFDINDKSLVINGEEYVTVLASKKADGFFVYSNKDFPYVMFYFYPSEEKMIMVGMQESENDTFLKSDSLNCHQSNSKEVLSNLGKADDSNKIIPKTLTAATVVPTSIVPVPLPTNPNLVANSPSPVSNEKNEVTPKEDVKQPQAEVKPTSAEEDLSKKNEASPKQLNKISQQEIVIPPPL